LILEWFENVHELAEMVRSGVVGYASRSEG
jgi:hypothetical protein